MGVKCRINDREYLLSWEEFMKLLSRKPLTKPIDVLAFVEG